MPIETGTPPRSALLAAWGNAWLAGDVALPEFVTRVTAFDDQHVVLGLPHLDAPATAAEVDGLGQDPAPGWSPSPRDETTVDRLLTRLRAAGVARLRLVLPAPGDVVGLPPPGAFTRAALTASEGVLALRPDGTGTGLVPALTHHGSPFDGTVTTVAWTAYAVVVRGPDPGPFLHDAEHDLRRGVVEAVSALRTLDVARWRPEVAQALDDLRSQARRGLDDDELPGSYPQRARQVLVQARQLGAVVSLALQDTGGAMDGREAVGREQALRELGRLVRRARVAAYNSYGVAS